MSVYDVCKDALSIAQKVDNIELYRILLDVQKQALDMQNDIATLQMENRELKLKISELEKIQITELDIEYYPNKGYITLKSDQQKVKYCGVCWGKEKVLLPICGRTYNYECGNCHTKFSKNSDEMPSTFPNIMG